MRKLLYAVLVFKLFVSVGQPVLKQSIKIHESKFKIFPRDESNQDASLSKFVEKLKKSIAQKDTALLYSCIDTSIIVSYGGGISGKKAFAEEWHLNHPETSRVWEAIHRIIILGGTFEESGQDQYFQYPYTHSNKLLSVFQTEFEPYFTAVCVDAQVKVFSKPDVNALLTDLLNYKIITKDLDFNSEKFVKIQTIDKKVTGFVLNTTLSHLSENTLIIKKNKNKFWKIIDFAAYD